MKELNCGSRKAGRVVQSDRCWTHAMFEATEWPDLRSQLRTSSERGIHALHKAVSQEFRVRVLRLDTRRKPASLPWCTAPQPPAAIRRAYGIRAHHTKSMEECKGENRVGASTALLFAITIRTQTSTRSPECVGAQ